MSYMQERQALMERGKSGTLPWLYLAMMIFAGILVFLLVLGVHNAGAKSYDPGGGTGGATAEWQRIKPRGPGGPPVVSLEGNTWQIKFMIFDRGGGTVATYGNPQGPYWFDTETECRQAQHTQEFKTTEGKLKAMMPPELSVKPVCVHFGAAAGEKVD